MSNAIKIVYLGGPTIILEIDDFRIITDPTLDAAGTKFPDDVHPVYWKLNGPAVEDVGKIDLVLLSHDQHGDNLDNKGRELLKKIPLTLTTKEGAERLQNNAKGLAPWESLKVHSTKNNEINITATPARHGPAGVEKLTGEVTGFIVSIKGKYNFETYITGDTVFYEGVKEVSKRFHPKYVFAFAGAAKARGPFSLTMTTNDMLDTAAAFPQATIIPLHFEGWSHYTETGEMIKKSFAVFGIENRLQIPVAGKEIELN